MNYSLDIISLFVNLLLSKRKRSLLFLCVYSSLIAQRVGITVVFITSVGVVEGLGF